MLPCEQELSPVKKIAKRESQKRELINIGTDARYVKRTALGRSKESDDVGRSRNADRARKAKTAVKSGYGPGRPAQETLSPLLRNLNELERGSGEWRNALTPKAMARTMRGPVQQRPTA